MTSSRSANTGGNIPGAMFPMREFQTRQITRPSSGFTSLRAPFTSYGEQVQQTVVMLGGVTSRGGCGGAAGNLLPALVQKGQAFQMTTCRCGITEGRVMTDQPMVQRELDTLQMAMPGSNRSSSKIHRMTQLLRHLETF
mmetsp:Transcript_26955/g.46192  ORF Transcript_26955/g.46192 Transcript_26955/m.46192 type:complete len:139 (+) Transcript_26955:616-1032(+)